jgi:hypothetical protein
MVRSIHVLLHTNAIGQFLILKLTGGFNLHPQSVFVHELIHESVLFDPTHLSAVA